MLNEITTCKDGKTGFDHCSIIPYVIPVTTTLMFLINTEFFILFSNTILGKLIAIFLIIYYTIIDKLLGLFICLLIIFYYQTDYFENTLNKYNWTNSFTVQKKDYQTIFTK
jgi:hypothetical protein